MKKEKKGHYYEGAKSGRKLLNPNLLHTLMFLMYLETRIVSDPEGKKMKSYVSFLLDAPINHNQTWSTSFFQIKYKIHSNPFVNITNANQLKFCTAV